MSAHPQTAAAGTISAAAPEGARSRRMSGAGAFAISAATIGAFAAPSRRRLVTLILRVLALLASLQAAPPPPVHPLDALTGDEIALAVRLARGDARLASAAFPSVALLEPAKAEVLAWQPGRALPRQARIQAMTPAQVYEVVVDLTARRVASVTERPGVEPSITYSEVEAAALVLKDRRFVDGLRGARDHRSHEAVLRAVRRRLLRDPRARREAADPRRLLRHAAIDHQRLRLAHRAAVRPRRSAPA